MKRILLFFMSLIIIFTFCSCGNQKKENNYFEEGSLLFDLGANSLDDIDYCELIDDGTIPEITIDKGDYNLFAEYRYKCVYPAEKLHELFIFPTNKPINISINGKAFSLYLMEDGSICVNSSKEKYKLYQADNDNQITPEKYDKLVKKYGK